MAPPGQADRRVVLVLLGLELGEHAFSLVGGRGHFLLRVPGHEIQAVGRHVNDA